MTSRSQKAAQAKIVAGKQKRRARSLGQARREMKEAWENGGQSVSGAKSETQDAIEGHQDRVNDDVSYS